MDNILVVRVSWRKRNVFYIRLPTRSIKSIKIFGLEESIPSGLQTGQLAPGYYQTFSAQLFSRDDKNGSTK